MPKASHLSLPGRFTALDGWRGICALLVALYHFHATSHFEQSAFIRHAYLLVDFFFVLSGFVITYAYWDRLYTLRDTGVMMWRRLGRLWPLHIVLLAVFVTLEVSEPLIAALLGVKRSANEAFDPGTSALLKAIPTNVLLLHGMGVHDRLTWNIPSWSISAEVWTYAVFAFVVVLARRWSVPAAIAIACLGAGVVAVYSPRLLAVDFDLGFFRCLYGFFCGHLIYRLARAVPVYLPMPTLIETGMLAVLVLFVASAGGTSLEFAAPLVFGAVVLVFAFERGAISRLLKSPPLRGLGLVSYSVYMVHGLVIAVAHRALTVLEQTSGLNMTTFLPYHGENVRFVSFGNAYAMDAVSVLYLGAVVALALVTWRYVEMPAQRLFNRADAGTAGAPAATVSVGGRS